MGKVASSGMNKNAGFYSIAGKHFGKLMTEWLQDTRVVAEACYRLRQAYDRDPTSIVIRGDSWKKRKFDYDTLNPTKEFSLLEPMKKGCIHRLLDKMLSSQFIILDTLWETYLSELSVELNTVSPDLFKDCLDSQYIQGALGDALIGNLTSMDDLRRDVGKRFASMITRKSWNDQWKDLQKLGVGLSYSSDKSQAWYGEMEEYFEMRNLIVHARGRVSDRLKELNPKYNKYSRVIIYPQHIDFFRKQFLSCVGFIEEKLKARISLAKK
jgi:hypothetical protein